MITDDFGLPTFPLSEPDYAGKRIRDLSPFEAALAGFPSERAQALDAVLDGATIAEIQAMLDTGDLTSVELVTYYVDRIRRFDLDKLNSVMELNADALADGAAADELRAAGTLLGPMHGIPVLLKDNIATGDGMHTTAGAYALKDWQPDRDAFLVQQLRESGAVILGKANLSEWANYMDPEMPNGFSTLGGQTRNPYGPFDPLGSSSGSAVAAAANLAAVTVGSETQGSIVSPAMVNSVVGLKTSRGLVSGDYVVPLVDWMDTPGPIGRNVMDVAILLTAMTGVDERVETDDALAAMQTQDYARHATPGAAEGLTVAIPVFDEDYLENEIDFLVELGVEADDALRATLSEDLNGKNQRLEALRDLIEEAGLNTVSVSATAFPGSAPVGAILEYGFQDSFNRFAAEVGEDFPVSELADVVAINGADNANRAPYGHSYVSGSTETEMSAEAYAAMKEQAMSGTGQGLNAMLEAGGANLLLINDLSTTLTQEYAAAGFPALTLPVGYGDDGQPLGILLTGAYLSEPELIAAAYAIEQVAQARRAPDLDSVLESYKGLNLAEPVIE